MAATALNVDGKKVLAVTTMDEKGLVVQLHDTTGDFQPIGNPEGFLRSESEEEYHRNLRKDAHAKGHFVKERSTNPEWNPEGE